MLHMSLYVVCMVLYVHVLHVCAFGIVCGMFVGLAHCEWCVI